MPRHAASALAFEVIQNGDRLVFLYLYTYFREVPLDRRKHDPESDAMHTVERWTRPDFNHLHLDLTVDDPKYYTRPFKYSRTWLAGKPGEGLKEYSCEENNVDRSHLGPGPGPIRPDGTRGYLVPTLPANPPSPEYYESR